MIDSSLEEKIATSVITIITYIHNNSYESVITSGLSSAITIPLLKAAWETLYPAEPIPNIYNLENEGNILLYKPIEGSIAWNEERRMELLNEFLSENYPDLNSRKEAHYIYVDDHSLGGLKLKTISGVFQRLGFTHLDFAVLTCKLSTRKIPGLLVGIEDDETTRLLNFYGDALTAPALEKNVEDEIKHICDYLKTK